MWRRSWRPSRFVLPLAAIAIAALYVIYSWVDPLPPRHLAIAAGPTGSGYDTAARRYGRRCQAARRRQSRVRNRYRLYPGGSARQGGTACRCVEAARGGERHIVAAHAGEVDRAD